jgi:hypothetical protein
MAVQPDFRLIAQGFNDLGDQFLRCSNLPAVDGGGALLAAIQGMRTDLGAIRRQIGDLSADVNRLDTRMEAS